MSLRKLCSRQELLKVINSSSRSPCRERRKHVSNTPGRGVFRGTDPRPLHLPLPCLLPPPPLGTHQASGDFTAAGAGSHTPPGRRQERRLRSCPQPGSLSEWPGYPRACGGATERSLGWEVLLPPSPSQASMEPRGLSGVLDCIPSKSGQRKLRTKKGFFQGHTGVG